MFQEARIAWALYLDNISLISCVWVRRKNVKRRKRGTHDKQWAPQRLFSTMSTYKITFEIDVLPE